MNPEEARQLLELARRLGSTPRRVLLHAARGADPDAASAAQILDEIRQTGLRHSIQADECANLLLTPISSYARDSLDAALSTLWKLPGQVEK
jgi:hypothetical protein